MYTKTFIQVINICSPYILYLCKIQYYEMIEREDLSMVVQWEDNDSISPFFQRENFFKRVTARKNYENRKYLFRVNVKKDF